MCTPFLSVEQYATLVNIGFDLIEKSMPAVEWGTFTMMCCTGLWRRYFLFYVRAPVRPRLSAYQARDTLRLCCLWRRVVCGCRDERLGMVIGRRETKREASPPHHYQQEVFQLMGDMLAYFLIDCAEYNYIIDVVVPDSA